MSTTEREWRQKVEAQLAKRARDGVVRLSPADRERARVEPPRPPVPRVTPAERVAMLLNLGRMLPLASMNRQPEVPPEERAERAAYLDAIAGQHLPKGAHEAFDARMRRVSGRLVLGAWEGGEQALWTVRDGARTIVAWVYRKTNTLSAKVTGPRRYRAWTRSTSPRQWALFAAELLPAAAGKVTRCGACGTWFARSSTRQRFCGPACGDKSRRRRRAAARDNAKMSVEVSPPKQPPVLTIS